MKTRRNSAARRRKVLEAVERLLLADDEHVQRRVDAAYEEGRREARPVSYTSCDRSGIYIKLYGPDGPDDDAHAWDLRELIRNDLDQMREFNGMEEDREAHIRDALALAEHLRTLADICDQARLEFIAGRSGKGSNG